MLRLFLYVFFFLLMMFQTGYAAPPTEAEWTRIATIYRKWGQDMQDTPGGPDGQPHLHDGHLATGINADGTVSSAPPAPSGGDFCRLFDGYFPIDLTSLRSPEEILTEWRGIAQSLPEEKEKTQAVGMLDFQDAKNPISKALSQRVDWLQTYTKQDDIVSTFIVPSLGMASGTFSACYNAYFIVLVEIMIGAKEGDGTGWKAPEVPSTSERAETAAEGGAPAAAPAAPFNSIQREPILLRISRGAPPFKLSDGSEVAISGSQLWVKEKNGPGYYAKPWEEYSSEVGLNILPVVEESASEPSSPTLRIYRGTPPFKLPDGSEVAHNGNDEFWVKKPGQTHYQTSWADYRTETGIPLQPQLVSRPKGFVDLRITRVSPLFKFPLPDGSEAHVNANNRVWVQIPNQSYPETRWEDYAYTWKLPIWPTVTAGESDALELHIIRGCPPFWLPGGYKIAINPADEVWVQEPGMTHYATPWDKFIEKLGLPVTVRITDPE